MRGIVIAGGLGTRLRPLTLTRPKPLIPLVNAPLLEYQLCYLRAAGMSEVVFATNYMAEAVEAEFGDGSRFGMRLRYARENEPLDTAGAIRNAYDVLPGRDCVVFNGDTIHAFDITAIINRHYERRADVTLTLKEVARPHTYGVVPVDSDGRVNGFYEPSDEEKHGKNPSSTSAGETKRGPDTINAGLYVMTAAAIEQIPCTKCNIEREVFPRLIREGWRVFGDVQTAFWIDIGRPAQYLDAVAAVVKGIVPCARPIRLVGDSAVEESAVVAATAEVVGSSSVGPGTRVEDGARIEASVVLEHAVIGQGAQIRRSIIGEGAVVGNFSRLEDTVVAPNSRLEEHTSRVGLV